MKLVQSVTVLTCNHEILYSTNMDYYYYYYYYLLILECSPLVRIKAMRHNSDIVSSITRILIPLNPLSLWFNIG
jgi:hypothetical protein